MQKEKRVDIEQPLMYEGSEVEATKPGKGVDKYLNCKSQDENVHIKRNGFLKKVFGIVAAQLLVTVIIVSVVVAAAQSNKEKPNSIFAFFDNKTTLFTSIGVFVLMTILLLPVGHAKTPDTKAIVEVCIFTIATSIMVGSIAMKTDPWKVLMCAGFTLADCLGIYAFLQWKGAKPALDHWITCKETFFTVSFILACALIFYMVKGSSDGEGMSIFKLAAIFLLFSFYLTLDIWLITENKYGSKIGIESYIFAAVKLYIDTIAIFLLALYTVASGMAG